MADGSFLNPTIYGKPLFPSAQRFGEMAQSALRSITPTAGTPPPTMAGVTVPPAGASFGQFQFKGPLLGTGPMFGLRGGGPQPAAQPTQPATNYGLAAATQFPFSYNVAASQTPSMQYAANAPQQLASAFTTPAPAISPQIPTQTPIGSTISEQRTITSTPRGNIYATPLQLENLNARTTAYVGRTPAEQQALLAQMRERGRSMAGAQETFFASKAQERQGLRAAEQVARAAGASAFDIMRAREATQPSSNLAATRGQAYGYTQMMPSQGLANTAATKFLNRVAISGNQPTMVGGLGPSSYALYQQQQPQRIGNLTYNQPQGFGISSLGTAYPSTSKRTRFIDNRYTQADATGSLPSMQYS